MKENVERGAAMLEEIRDRVNSGAAFFDAIRPGWHNEIDPTSIYMFSSSYCILGHLYGEFFTGFLAISKLPNYTDTYSLGLLGETWEYKHLSQEWSSLIRERRNG